MSGNNWQSVNLGDEAQTNKFHRLMGGKKSAGPKTDTPPNPATSRTEGNLADPADLVPTNELAEAFDEQRKNKFFRLMGGKKGNNQSKQEDFEKKSLGPRTSEDENRMQKELESQYQQSLSFKLSGAARRHTGLGFAPDNPTEQGSDKTSEGAPVDLSNKDQQQQQHQQDRDREARGDRDHKSDRSHDHRDRSHDHRERSHDHRDRSRDYRDGPRDYRDRSYDQRDRSYEHRDRSNREEERGNDRRDRGSDRSENRDRYAKESQQSSGVLDYSTHKNSDYGSSVQPSGPTPETYPSPYSHPPKQAPVSQPQSERNPGYRNKMINFAKSSDD